MGFKKIKELPEDFEVINCVSCYRKEHIPNTNNFEFFGNIFKSEIYLKCKKCGDIFKGEIK